VNVGEEEQSNLEHVGRGYDSLFKHIINIVMMQVRLSEQFLKIAMTLARLVFSPSLHLHLFTLRQDNFPVVFYDSFVFV
jgi:hypothetical protein